MVLEPQQIKSAVPKTCFGRGKADGKMPYENKLPQKTIRLIPEED
jgi:hypothetical protein